MKLSIVGVEHVLRDERYMDDKGWSFKKAFQKLGGEVEVFVYRKKGRLAFIEKSKQLKGFWRSHVNRALLEHVRRSRPDLLLLLKAETITADTLWQIRKTTDTMLVNVFPDNPFFMGRFEAIEPCHFFFVKDSYVVDTLRKAGLKNVLYLPQCTDPDVHRPMKLDENERAECASDVCLLGSMYPYRAKLMEHLTDFDLAIWGRGWQKSTDQRILGAYRGRDIRGTMKAKAIGASAISLNPHHPLNDINGVNRRTFDIAACGGFQLADHKPDMATVYDVDREIVCYRTLEDLKALIAHYLAHPDERRAIAEAAYLRTLRDHTYEVRAQQILDITGTG